MHNERGVILLVVLWALMVLMVISAELARTMRIEGLTTYTYQQEVETYYLAQAGLHRALYQFLRAQQQGRTLLDRPDAIESSRRDLQDQQDEEDQAEIWTRGDGRWHGEAFGAGGYHVRVSDESGKFNLNQVDEGTLRQAFTNLGFEAELGETLTDAILDWRDSDSLVRLHGTESEYYLSLPVPYPAKDGPFDTPEELLLVRGITPELFTDGLRDIFTVYRGSGRGSGPPNLLTAGPLVLQAVLGIDAEAAHELVAQRAETGGIDIANLLPGNRGSNFGLPSVVTIESIGYLRLSGVTRRISAVVQRQGANGFRLLRWQDRQDGQDMPAIPGQQEEPG